MRLDVNIWTVIPKLTLKLSYFFSREKKFSSSKSTAATFIIKFIFIICHMGCISTFKWDTKSNAIQNDLHFTEIHSHRVKSGMSSVHRWWLIKIHVFFDISRRSGKIMVSRVNFPKNMDINSIRFNISAPKLISCVMNSSNLEVSQLNLSNLFDWQLYFFRLQKSVYYYYG